MVRLKIELEQIALLLKIALLVNQESTYDGSHITHNIVIVTVTVAVGVVVIVIIIIYMI